MRNPVKTIREARRQADSLLSGYEIAFALLVANDANEADFDQQLGFGLFTSFQVTWWERLRFNRKLRQMYAKALERLAIRREVMSKGMQEIALAAWPKEIETK